MAVLTTMQRRALELLGGNPAGCSEHLKWAHGYDAEFVARLIRAGLATSIGGGRIQITDKGRVALEAPAA